MKKYGVGIFVLVLLVFLSTVLVSAEPIKLGLVGPMTGPLAPYGEGVRDGALLAAAQINANGGIMGRQIEIIVLDNQANPQETITLVNRLIQRDNIVGLVGPVISATSSVAGPQVQRQRIPMITPTATAVGVTRVGDYVFRVCYLDDHQGLAGANYATNDLGAKKAGILYKAGDAYSVGLRDVFQEQFIAAGGEVIDVAYNAGDSDFSAQLTRLKNAEVEVVYSPFYYEDAVIALKQADSIGLDAVFIGADGWDAQELLDQAGLAAVNAVFTTHYSIDDQRPIVQTFLTDFQEQYGRFPIVLAALGYDAAALMINSIDRAQSTNAQEIRAAIASTQAFEGVTGQSISLDDNGDPIKNITIIRVIEVDGAAQFEYVTQVSY